jgi:hypothetical protein
MTKAILVSVAMLVGSQSARLPLQRIDLAERLSAGKLRVVNRQATTFPGKSGAVHLSEKADVGIAWVG